MPLHLLICVQVHRVFIKGAASLEGTIQRGDNVLSINGTSMEGRTHGEALSCLHHARLFSQALVVIRKSRESEVSVSDTQDMYSHPRRICSTADKSLEAGTGKECYIYSNVCSLVKTNLMTYEILTCKSELISQKDEHRNLRG